MKISFIGTGLMGFPMAKNLLKKNLDLKIYSRTLEKSKPLEEFGGKIIKKNGSKVIEFYGSSSETALNKHYGGHADYRSSEGKKVQLKYRGKINDTVLNILGGLRSSCTYVGAPSLKQLSKCTTFVRVNQQYNDTFE